MLVEKFIPTEVLKYGFDSMTATVLRMHDIELLGSEMIGSLTDPDASDLFLRVNDINLRLRLERKQDGSWGNYLWDQARLITPDRKDIKGEAGNVPVGAITALKAFFPSSSPKPGQPPQPI